MFKILFIARGRKREIERKKQETKQVMSVVYVQQAGRLAVKWLPPRTHLRAFGLGKHLCALVQIFCHPNQHKKFIRTTERQTMGNGVTGLNVNVNNEAGW